MEIILIKLPGELVKLPSSITKENIQHVSVRKDVGETDSAGGERDRE